MASQENNRRPQNLRPEYAEHTLVGGKRMRTEIYATLSTNIEQQHDDTVVLSSDEEVEQTPTRPTPLAVYPPTGRGFTLYENDMNCLCEGKFINDQIVNFVLAWVVDTELSSHLPARLCDSHMVPRLVRDMEKAPESKRVETLRHNYRAVSDWFPGGGPFDRPVVFIPVCKDKHWFLLVVRTVFDSVPISAQICVSNSMGHLAQNQAIEAVKRLIAFTTTPTINIEVAQVPVQQQRNGYDCGLYLINFAWRFAKLLARNPKATVKELAETANTPPSLLTRIEVRDTIFKISQTGNLGPQFNTELYITHGPQHNTLSNPKAQPVLHCDEDWQYPQGTENNQVHQTCYTPELPTSIEHLKSEERTDDEAPTVTHQQSNQVIAVNIAPKQEVAITANVRLINRSTVTWWLNPEEIQEITSHAEDAITDTITQKKRRINFKREVGGQAISFHTSRATTSCEVTLKQETAKDF